MPFAEEILQLFLLSFEERKAYFSERFPGFGAMMTDDQLDHLLGDYGVQALKENRLSPQQAAGMDAEQLECLLHESGVQAPREKLITTEQSIVMDTQWEREAYSYYLLAIELLTLR